MTDDLSRELAEIAGDLPAVPRGLAELRALIATMPTPTPLALPGVSDATLPTTEQQTAEIAAGQMVSTGGATSAAAPVPSLPSGTISGSQIAPGTLSANAFAPSIRPIQLVEGPSLPTLPAANFPEGSVVFNFDDGVLYRNEGEIWRTATPETSRNILQDPTLESADLGSYHNASEGQYPVGRWTSVVELLAGTPATNAKAYVDVEYIRTSSYNAFHSALLSWYVEMDAGVTEVKSWIWPTTGAYSWQTVLPYVVAAVKFISWGETAGVTEAELTIEITENGTVVAYQTVDLLTVDEEVPYLLWTAAPRTAEKTYSTRYWVRLKRTSSVGSDDAYPVLGEPQLHWSSTPDPGEFSPPVGKWVPSEVEEITARAIAAGVSRMSLRNGELLLRPSNNSTDQAVRIDQSGMEFQAYAGGYPTTTTIDAKLARVEAKKLRLWDGSSTPGPIAVEVIGDILDDGLPLKQVGWEPYAYMPGFNAAGAYTSALTLAANGGCLAIPILVAGRMHPKSVSVWNTDAATARSWNWALYVQSGQNASNTLDRVAVGSAADAFTPGAASKRTIVVAGGVTLPPGLYWLVIQNNHATSTFGLGSVASGTLSHDRAQTKTLTVPVGDTLDFVAATWAQVQGVYAVVLEGHVFARVQLVELPLIQSSSDTATNMPLGRALFDPTLVRL